MTASSVLQVITPCSKSHHYKPVLLLGEKHKGGGLRASAAENDALLERQTECEAAEPIVVGFLEMLWSMGGPTGTMSRQDAERCL